MKHSIAVAGVLLLATTSSLAVGPRAAPKVSAWDNAQLMCRYVHRGSQSFISCEDQGYDPALSDEPQRVREIPMYTLPMSQDDFERAEQLVDSVMCYGSKNCTATLLRPTGL